MFAYLCLNVWCWLLLCFVLGLCPPCVAVLCVFCCHCCVYCVCFDVSGGDGGGGVCVCGAEPGEGVVDLNCSLGRYFYYCCCCDCCVDLKMLSCVCVLVLYC